MTKRTRGIALIINNMDFQKARDKRCELEDREESQFDADNLRNLFAELSFHPIVLDNLTAEVSNNNNNNNKWHFYIAPFHIMCCWRCT